MFEFLGYTFDIFSIAFCVIALIGMIKGIKNGFFKLLINFVKKIVALVAAIFLSVPVGNKLYGFNGFGDQLKDKLYTSFANQGGLFDLTINNQIATDETAMANAKEALTSINIPSIVHGPVINLLASIAPTDGSDIVLANALSQALATYAFIAIAFILIFVGILILCAILNKVLENINKVPGIGGLNRLLGMALGLIIALFDICLLCYGLSFILSSSLSFVPTLEEWMSLNDDSVKSIAKTIYLNNPLSAIIVFVQEKIFLK